MSQRTRRILGRVITLACWMLAIAMLLLSFVWPVSGLAWELDLVANLGAQALVLMLVVAAIVAVCRRFRALAVVGVAIAVQTVPLCLNRAAVFPKAVAIPSLREPTVVRMLHYNDSVLSTPTEVYRLIAETDADVVEILCPPVFVQTGVIYGQELSDRFPGKIIRPWKPMPDGFFTDHSPCFVVSRWPIEPVDTSFAGPMSGHVIAGVVDRPGARFAIIAAHPRSPRTQQRWQEGNQVVEAVAMVANRLRSQGLPVVVLTDLNSSPTGVRSRRLGAGADLRRSKPIFELTGTYPDVIPLSLRFVRKSRIPAAWPASIAIDDAMISPEIDVVGWTTLPKLKSEHTPIVVDLRIPPPRALGSNPSGR